MTDLSPESILDYTLMKLHVTKHYVGVNLSSHDQHVSRRSMVRCPTHRLPNAFLLIETK